MAYNNNDSILVRNVGGTSAPRYRIADLHTKFQRAGGTSSTRCQDWMLCWVCNHHNNPHFKEPYPLRKNAFMVPVRQITGT